jgi:hypothetical protein
VEAHLPPWFALHLFDHAAGHLGLRVATFVNGDSWHSRHTSNPFECSLPLRHTKAGPHLDRTLDVLRGLNNEPFWPLYELLEPEV